MKLIKLLRIFVIAGAGAWFFAWFLVVTKMELNYYVNEVEDTLYKQEKAIGGMNSICLQKLHKMLETIESTILSHNDSRL